MKINSVLSTALSLLLFISCSYDGEVHCIDDRGLSHITAIDAPETGTVNEKVEVAVSFEVKNTCGQFGDFKVSTSEETRTIEVEAIYEGCDCAEILTIRSTTYSFTPAKAGEHILKFKSAPEHFIKARIIIQEEPAEE